MAPNKNSISETEKAMEQQPGLLGLDWKQKLAANERKAIKGAKRITFVGTGSSHHCALWAHWLAREFAAPALETRVLTSWDFLTGGHSEDVRRDELVVLISHRGYRGLTREVLGALKKKKHSRAILICGDQAPTGGFAHLYTSPQEISQAHTMSLIGAMAAASEIVATACTPKHAQALRSQRETTAALLLAIESEKEELGNALQGLMTRGSGLHFIGGGSFYAVALELALKAREIIHMPAHGYNTEEFLHGPVASIEDEDTVILLKPRLPSNASTELKTLYDSRSESCRKAAEAVGALVLEPAWGKAVENTARALAFSWQALLPMYWGQVLCVSTAALWGVNPDLNRRDDPRYAEAARRAEL